MAKPPRTPRSIARDTRMEAPRVPGPAVAPPADIRQTDLFRPPFVEPCKPALRDKLPVGPPWRYEVKHDGYRLQAHSIAGEVCLYTKRGLDWTDRMPGIRDAVAALGRDIVLDGEATMLNDEGIADFFFMARSLASRRRMRSSSPSTASTSMARTSGPSRSSSAKRS